MAERVALKILTGSDLTFFDSFFKKSNVGNQKAINLNANVFAKYIYPDFAAGAHGIDIEVPVRVTIFGPQRSKPYQLYRSITKKRTYKNWRLNGAAVPDPDDEPHKFDRLSPGDVAVMEFFGSPEPQALHIVIVSQADDSNLHAALTAEVSGNRNTMVVISRKRLVEIATLLRLENSHPISILFTEDNLDESIDDALRGAEPAIRKLRERTGRKLTRGKRSASTALPD